MQASKSKPCRSRKTTGLFVFMLFAVGLATCSASPEATDDPEPTASESGETEKENTEKTDREETDSETKPSDFGEELQRAVELLERGAFSDATELLATIREGGESESRTDRVARLYQARARLGALDAESSEMDRRNALGGLNELAEEPGVDGEVRRSARLYWAVATMASGDWKAAAEALSGRSSDAPGGLVLDRDEYRARTTLLESHIANRSWMPAVRTAGELYSHQLKRQKEGQLEGRSEGESSSDTPSSSSDGSGDGGAAESTDDERTDNVARFNYIRSRGFRAAGELGSEDLERLMQEDEPFLRAVAGWTFLTEELDSESLNEEQRERIQERYREVASALNAIGASNRLSEISLQRATLAGDERLVVAAVVPMSGSKSAVGQRAIDGMLLAMRAFQHRGQSRVTLVFRDSARDATSTVKALDDLGVSAMVGPLDRRRASAYAKVAAERGIPMLAMTAAGVEVDSDDGAPFVLRNFMSPLGEARAAARYAARERDDERLAILYPQVGYGRRTRKAFADEFRRLGGEVVASVGYDQSASDYSAPAAKIAEASPDAVFIPDAASTVAELVAFLAQEGVWGRSGDTSGDDEDRTYVHYYGTSLWQAEVLEAQASEYVKGAVVPAWYGASFDAEATRRFGRRFRGVFDRGPSNIEAFAHDNVRWLRRLMLERGLHEREALRDALVAGASFRGATGWARFDEEGRLHRRVRFLTVGDSGLEPTSVRVELFGPSRAEKRRSGPTRDESSSE